MLKITQVEALVKDLVFVNEDSTIDKISDNGKIDIAKSQADF